MRTRTKLAAFALVLGAAFGIGSLVGGAVGPIDVGDSPTHDGAHEVDDEH